MDHSFFTSESVSIGHPDKIADQISDAILDECLALDSNARVACETLVTRGVVFIAGEITTSATIDFQDIARRTIEEIGYNDPLIGFDSQSCGIICSVNQQSPDIAQGINEQINPFKDQGAGDQGIMYGYACDETPEFMPMPIMLAHGLVRALRIQREKKILSYLLPDAKSQITLEYDAHQQPIRLHTVVVSTQHSDQIDQKTLADDIKKVVQEVIPLSLMDSDTIFHINPAGRFVIGGPLADCGLTGRKIMVDTYGGIGRHGGGAFSGKDPSKVDRSAGYTARYIAKNIVAAKLAKRCEVQLSYAIGISHPISINIDTFGTGTVSEEILRQVIPLVFQLSPRGMIQMLNLKRPIYRKTAYEGHFGRNDPDFTWEQTDRVEALLIEIKRGLKPTLRTRAPISTGPKRGG